MLAVDIGAAFLEVAVNAILLHHAPVFADRSLVRGGVGCCANRPERGAQPTVDQPALRRDFCRGIARLTACHPVRLQNHHLMPVAPERIGAQEPRHPGADDGDFTVQILPKPRARLDLTAFAPNGFHYVSPHVFR